MPFYTYDQNNSGGSFAFDAQRGITAYVIIEAFSETHADHRAERIGLYWDGCSTGRDCGCCGDRWHRAFISDKDSEPSVYGKPVAEAFQGDEFSWMAPEKEAAVHYLSGRIEWFGVPEARTHELEHKLSSLNPFIEEYNSD